jgi:hypothetical protein
MFQRAGTAIVRLEFVSVDGPDALHTIWSGLEGSIGQIFGVTLGSGYSIGFVIFRAVGGVAWIGFGVEIGGGHRSSALFGVAALLVLNLGVERRGVFAVDDLIGVIVWRQT